jgi:hypothetical protein
MVQNDSTILDLSQTIFSALVLIISAGLTSHFFHGYNSKKWRTSFIGLLLLMLIGTQVYYLIKAVLYIPTYPYQYDATLLRHDCLESGKGGKRSKYSTEVYDTNPCYNTTNNVTNTTNNEPYLSYTRDCQGGRGGSCTQVQPCDPCDRDLLSTFQSGRCRTCSSAFRGTCNFIPGVGPYCRESIDSKVVVPCKRCCTDGTALYVNGTCY